VKLIYLDYNATTPLCDTAREAMLPYLDRFFGNPSSVHAAGRETRAAIDNARDAMADLLHARPHEIIFTGGGTESNNLAVLGLARSRASHGKHLISCRTEHHAVLNAFEHLQQREGFDVSWIPVSGDGVIDLDQLKASIRPDTTLVSIMTANNETGVIQPLQEISEICRAAGVLLHSDMVQSFGKIETNIGLVDAASFAAHKIYGPKGAGFLFLRSGLSVEPIMFGGAHENQRRPGTENVAGIVGMADAATWSLAQMTKEQPRETELRDRLWRGIFEKAPGAMQNGGTAARLGNTLNVSFPQSDSETMLMALDLEGVCASSGSACMVGSVVASHVLLAAGLPVTRAGSAIRFSLGKDTSKADVEETIAVVTRIVSRLDARKTKAQAYAAV
jgi:cysteine desulfurase